MLPNLALILFYLIAKSSIYIFILPSLTFSIFKIIFMLWTIRTFYQATSFTFLYFRVQRSNNTSSFDLEENGFSILYMGGDNVSIFLCSDTVDQSNSTSSSLILAKKLSSINKNLFRLVVFVINLKLADSQAHIT